MIDITTTQLAQIIGGQLSEGAEKIANGICIDSREVREGDCFFAIAGENFDGHKFVESAFEKGAACAVVSKELAITGKAIIKVDDTVKAIGKLAKWYRSANNFKVVAITGSVGKTTTREILSCCLGVKFKVHQSPKNFNNFIGLPLTILSAEKECEILIVELGTNSPGEIEYLSRIAGPDIAVVTNVYPAHLGGFGSLEAIAKEKASIVAGFKQGGMLIVNRDCEVLTEAVHGFEQRMIGFGKSDKAEVKISNVEILAGGSRFRLGDFAVQVGLPGLGNVYNAACAWAVCREVGFTIEEFADAIEKMPKVSMRAEVIKTGTVRIINDCYNANPASMENALGILSAMEIGSGRRVFVCGDMAELGEKSAAFHCELGEQAMKNGVDVFIAVGAMSKMAAEAGKKLSKEKMETVCFGDVGDACNNLREFVRDDDIILVKGSRSARLEGCVEEIMRIFCREKS